MFASKSGKTEQKRILQRIAGWGVSKKAKEHR